MHPHRPTPLVCLIVLAASLLAPRHAAAEPKDAWASLWATPALAEVDLAWLDRDPARVRQRVAQTELAALPAPVRGRLLFFDGLAAEQLGRAGEGADALAQALGALSAGDPVDRLLADHVRYHRARLLLDAGRADASDALRLVDQLAPKESLFGDYPLLRGRALLAAGRPQPALDHLAELAPKRGDRIFAQRDELLYLQGLAKWRRGERKDAAKDFATLASDFPTSPRVSAVLPLVDLELSAAERLDLAQSFLAARQYDATTVLLETVAGDSGQRLGDEARYKLGYVHYRLRRIDRDVGIRYLEGVASGKSARADDAMVLLARAWMRRDNYAKALEVWRAFRLRFPKHKDADEAIYYHGWLPMDREQWDDAIPAFERYIEAYPDGARVENARWYLGWAHFRAGHPGAAITAWKDLLAHAHDWLETSKALYWLVRAFDKLGKPGQGKAFAQRLGRDFPHTYYAQLLAHRTGAPNDLSAAPAPPPALDPVAAWAAIDGLPAVRTRVRLVRDLVHLDLLVEANAHVGPQLRHDVLAAAARKDDKDAAEDLVLFLQEEVGDVAQVYRESARRGAAFKQDVTPENVATWRRTYPRPYRRIVEHEAARRGISPLFVWSIMQKESGYDPLALSYADAMGLMQIIPKTGRRIAAELHEPYREGMLFEPHVNIAYAAWYLSELLRKFGGQIALASAGYNGGPTAVVRWLEQNALGDKPLAFDAWIEEIAYDQARGYARKVLTILGRYIMVYPARDEGADALRDGLYPPGLRVVDSWRDNIDF